MRDDQSQDTIQTVIGGACAGMKRVHSACAAWVEWNGPDLIRRAVQEVDPDSPRAGQPTAWRVDGNENEPGNNRRRGRLVEDMASLGLGHRSLANIRLPGPNVCVETCVV